MEQVTRLPLSAASKRLDDQARDGRSGRPAGARAAANSALALHVNQRSVGSGLPSSQGQSPAAYCEAEIGGMREAPKNLGKTGTAPPEGRLSSSGAEYWHQMTTYSDPGRTGVDGVEVGMVDVADFGPNPNRSSFGRFGALTVRHGKGANGSGPRRREILTVFGWAPEVLDQFVNDIRRLTASIHPRCSSQSAGVAFRRSTSIRGLLVCATSSGCLPS